MTNCVKWYLNLIQAADSPYTDPHAGSVDFGDHGMWWISLGGTKGSCVARITRFSVIFHVSQKTKMGMSRDYRAAAKHLNEFYADAPVRERTHVGGSPGDNTCGSISTKDEYPDYRPGVITKRSSGVIGFVKLAKGESVYGICELGNYLG